MNSMIICTMIIIMIVTAIIIMVMMMTMAIIVVIFITPILYILLPVYFSFVYKKQTKQNKVKTI